MEVWEYMRIRVQTPTLPHSHTEDMMRRLFSRFNPDAILLLICFLAAFALYARTVAPGVLDDDGGEFQTNIYRLGVSHTGYPLYFLLGKLWTLVVPLGSIAYRANLFSSFFGALTVGLIYITMRALADSRPAAFFTAALFAVSRVEWSQSVIPRVYTLNSFIVVLVILLAVLWRRGRISLLWLVFAYGLSLTHHRTMLLFGPALALFILLGEGRALFRPKRLAGLFLAFVLPLLLYVYIPLRGESDVGVEYHASNFAEMILAGNASVWLRFGPPGFLWYRFTSAYLPLMLEQFTLIGASLGLLGIIVIVRNRAPRGFPPMLPPRQLLLLLGGVHLFEAAFAIVFWTFDSEKYFIPSYLTFLFLVGIGLAFAFDRLAQAGLPAAPTRRLAPIALSVIFLAVCFYLGWTNYSKVDQSANDLAQSRWQEILAQPLEPNALVVSNWEPLTALEYYQYVENRRRDLRRDKVVIYKDQLKLAPQGDVGSFIARELAAGRAVYLTLHPSQTETLGALSERFNLVPVASLWRVENHQPPATSSPLNIRFGDNLWLESVALSRDLHAGDFAEAAFVWRADKPLDAQYKFSLRLEDASGNIWMQRDNDPFGGLKPTTEWATDQDITDTEGFFIPPDAPPGVYSLELAIYNAESHAPLDAGDKAVQPLATLRLAPSDHALPREAYQIPSPLDLSTGGNQIIGFGLSPQEPRAGEPLQLDTWWSGLGSGEAEIHIELEDGRGARTIVYSGAIVQNARGAFDPRQIVRTRHTFTLPPTAAPGRAALSLLVNGQRFEITRFKLRASDRLFTAPDVAHPQASTLGTSIQFLGYDLPSASVKPGGDVAVKLYWHVTQPVKQSYKVFVHLLDPNGILRAQQDSIPQRGNLPTDQWLTGEYVGDEYTLAIPADVQPGNYRIEIGMYSPGTGVRIPASDSSGAPLPDDRVLLGTPVRIAR
jgi:hypothetical protein